MVCEIGFPPEVPQIWEAMAASNTIEWVNPACEAMFGWPLEEIRGRRPQEFVLPPELRPSPERMKAFRYDFNRSIFLLSFASSPFDGCVLVAVGGQGSGQ